MSNNTQENGLKDQNASAISDMMQYIGNLKQGDNNSTFKETKEANNKYNLIIDSNESSQSEIPLTTTDKPAIVAELHQRIIKECLRLQHYTATKTTSSKKQSNPMNNVSVTDLLNFRLVNRSWAANVDHYLRSLKTMTLEVVPGPQKIADYLHHLTLPPGGPEKFPERTLSVEEAVALEDISGTDFEQITQNLNIYNANRHQFHNHDHRTAPLYHQLPDGPVFRLTTKQLPAFLGLLKGALKSCEKSFSNSLIEEPQSLQLKSLSFAFLLNHPEQHFEHLDLHMIDQFTIVTKDMYLLFDLLDLYPNLQHLWLTLNLYKPQPKFLSQLIDYLVKRPTQNSFQQHLKTLDLNFINITSRFTGGYNRLAPLMLHLTHFGLTDELTVGELSDLLKAASSKLTSLKVNSSPCFETELSRLSSVSGGLSYPENRVAQLNCNPEILNSVTSLVIISPPKVRTLFLSHFTSLTRLKLVHVREEDGGTAELRDFGADEFALLKPMHFLQSLTLVNFDLLDCGHFPSQLPQVTSLTIISGCEKVFLKHFLVDLANTEQEDVESLKIDGDNNKNKNEQLKYNDTDDDNEENEDSSDSSESDLDSDDEEMDVDESEEEEKEEENDETNKDEDDDDVRKDVLKVKTTSTKKVNAEELMKALSKQFANLKALTLIGVVCRPKQLIRELTEILKPTTPLSSSPSNQPKLYSNIKLQLHLTGIKNAFKVPLRYGRGVDPNASFRSVPMVRTPKELLVNCTCNQSSSSSQQQCPLVDEEEFEFDDEDDEFDEEVSDIDENAEV